MMMVRGSALDGRANTADGPAVLARIVLRGANQEDDLMSCQASTRQDSACFGAVGPGTNARGKVRAMCCML